MTEQEAIQELAGTWALLEVPGTKRLRTAKTSLRLNERDVYVAVDKVGARYLLLPHDLAPDEAAMWRNRSMDLSRSNLVGDDGSRRTWLLLRCKRADVEEAFARLCAHLVLRASEVPIGDLTEQCKATLEEWQELFGGLGSSEQSLTGLIGEMLLLLRLARTNPELAWQTWVGPRGGRHDFRKGTIAIEVKTTIRATGRVITINGLAQLSPPIGGTLHIMFCRLERVPGGSISLQHLVEQLQESGISRTDLLSLLDDLGFRPGHDKTAFELREEGMYVVGASFPRIVQDSFDGGRAPLGVSELSYAVDLDHARPISLEEEGFMLTGFATK